MHAHTMLLFYLILILEEVFVVAEVDVVVNTVCVCVWRGRTLSLCIYVDK